MGRITEYALLFRLVMGAALLFFTGCGSSDESSCLAPPVPYYECSPQTPGTPGCTPYGDDQSETTYPEGCEVILNSCSSWLAGMSCKCMKALHVDAGTTEFFWACQD